MKIHRPTNLGPRHNGELVRCSYGTLTLFEKGQQSHRSLSLSAVRKLERRVNLAREEEHTTDKGMDVNRE